MPENNETIFSGATPPESVTPPIVPPVSTPTVPPEVAEYVGQGKKYASVDDALKSVPHAQKFIDKLAADLEEAKKELERRKTAEELLKEIKAGSTETPPPQGEQVTPDSVSKIVEQAIAKKQQQEQAMANTQKVAEAFRGQYADKAEQIYNALAVESGLSVAMLNQLAATSPAAVLRMAGITGKQGSQSTHTPSSSSVNTDALGNKSGQVPLSARVKAGASTKDLVDAWKIAGEKVKSNQN